MAARKRGPIEWQFEPTSGNRLVLYTVGDDAFAAAYDAITGARRRVWLETYIFQPDEVGNMARDALADAASRGCDVILLYDRWGSPRIGRSYAEPILEAGGRVAVYNPVLPWQKLGRKIAPVFHRDHRKILITDDIGFCGGANVSLDYGGPGPELFFDMTLRIEGPCVHDLGALFLDTLKKSTGTDAPLGERPTPFPDGVTAQVLALDRRHREQDLDFALLHALRTSESECLLMTPYFVPPHWLIDSLMEASRRGVDVRILTAGKSDVPLARVAGRHLYSTLLEAGIRVFEMQHPVLHAKCVTIDGRYSIVGSYNVDAYGGKHNLEVGVATSDPAVASQLAEEFNRRSCEAREITDPRWSRRARHEKAAEAVLYHLFRI